MKNVLAHNVQIRPCRSIWWTAVFMYGAVLHETRSEGPTLAALSFEELSQIQVTTASKRSEPFASTSAAISVLTGDEIIRTGATVLPNALRYVPGLDVAQNTSTGFGVGARGFGGQYANQLLVMIDGRSIYNPTFGGVFWGFQDTFFEDLERIEVVRGPGGALWGANAVNGVINILSKDARDTQGTLLFAGAGDLVTAKAGARQGFQLSEHTFARIYFKYLDMGRLSPPDGIPDPWNRTQAGFRLDHHPNNATHLTVQGDFTHTRQRLLGFVPNFTPPSYGEVVVFPNKHTGANLLGRWTHELAEASSLMIQGYWDYTDAVDGNFLDRQNILDLELQHNLHFGDRHAPTCGMGYRLLIDQFTPSPVISVPGREKATDQVLSAFAQDEITLMRETLFLTLGAKVEHNDYSGWEFQPNARLRWQAAKNQTVWAAVSRAAATPNRLSTGMALNYRMMPPGALGAGSPATLVQIQGAVKHPEKLIAYELGYRLQPTTQTSIDLTSFYNDYSDLQNTQYGTPDVTATTPTLPVYWANGPKGHTYGAELSAGWEPLTSHNWQLQASYTCFHSNVTQASIGRDAGTGSPRHKATLRSTVHLGRSVELDTGLRFVDRLTGLNIPSYTELDLRLAWKPDDHWELALVGQNLLHDHHPEHPPGLNIPQAKIPRSLYATAIWKY